MPSDSDLSANKADQPIAGQWKFTAYNHDFSSADGQAGDIVNGVPTGEGYSTDFDINRIVNAARGDAPSADANDVGISFTSSLKVASGGTYRLTTSSDDGSRIIIRDGKGNPVPFDNQTGGRLDYLNNDFHQGLTTRYGDVELAPGTYSIEILYWENQGANLLFGTISGPDTQGSSQDLTRSSMIGVPPALTGTESRESVCFVRGTLILTGNGPRPVESLRCGDLIVTRDSGVQPIRWIGSQILTSENLCTSPKNRPIRISAGALALNVPSQDLLVSPQHRIMLRFKIAFTMFGQQEVLVAAKHLCGVTGIDVDDDAEGVEYFHMLFDQHEVVFSNGAETESLYPGRQALKCVGPKSLRDIFTIFPHLEDTDREPAPARPLVPGRKARKLVERHLNNGKPLVSTTPISGAKDRYCASIAAE